MSNSTNYQQEKFQLINTTTISFSLKLIALTIKIYLTKIRIKYKYPK